MPLPTDRARVCAEQSLIAIDRNTQRMRQSQLRVLLLRHIDIEVFGEERGAEVEHALTLPN